MTLSTCPDKTYMPTPIIVPILSRVRSTVVKHLSRQDTESHSICFFRASLCQTVEHDGPMLGYEDGRGIALIFIKMRCLYKLIKILQY